MSTPALTNLDQTFPQSICQSNLLSDVATPIQIKPHLSPAFLVAHLT
jgi:hypothetical protein